MESGATERANEGEEPAAAAGSEVGEDVIAFLRAGRRDPQATGEVLERYRRRLQQLVDRRLDARLRSRLDASDIVQETFIEAMRRLEEYLEDPKLPFELWLRRLASDKVIQAYRRHLLSRKRDRRLELSIDRIFSRSEARALATDLHSKTPSPSEALLREEENDRVVLALSALDSRDRDMLALRHFEEMTTVEIAEHLGISETAARSRYARALKRLAGILERVGPR